MHNKILPIYQLPIAVHILCCGRILFGIISSVTTFVSEFRVMFQKENIVTIPNMLTGLRIAMTPFLGYLVLQQCYPMACIIFIITGITDVVCHHCIGVNVVCTRCVCVCRVLRWLNTLKSSYLRINITTTSKLIQKLYCCLKLCL